MKILVFALFVAYASAKPTIAEIPTNSYGVPISQDTIQYSSGSNILSSPTPSFQNLQLTKDISGSLNLGQPLVSNAGSYGISYSTAAPISYDSVLPSSTISPLLSGADANINLGGVSSANFLYNSNVQPVLNSQVVSEIPSVTPLSVLSPSVSTIQLGSINPTVSSYVSKPVLTNSLVAPLINPGYASYNYKQSISTVPNYQSLNQQYVNQNQYVNQGGYYENNYQLNHTQTPIVSKHLYYFEAPQDYEEVRARKIVQVAPPQKTYKIIFIKAPSAPELGPIDIPVQTQNEEKTLVYVLSKKPETEQQVRVQSSSTLKQSKPEVFFIKYNTKEEAEKAILDAQAGLGGGSAGASYVDASQLVSSITQEELRTLQNKQLRQQEHAHQIQNQQVLEQQNVGFGSSLVNNAFEANAQPILKNVEIKSSSALPYVETSSVLPLVSQSYSTASPQVYLRKEIVSATPIVAPLSQNVNTIRYQSSGLPIASISGNVQSYTPLNSVYKTTSYSSAKPIGFSSTFNTGVGSGIFSASSNTSPLKISTEYLPSFASREEQAGVNIQQFENKNQLTNADEDKTFTTLSGSNLSQVNTLVASEEATNEKEKVQSTTSTTL